MLMLPRAETLRYEKYFKCSVPKKRLVHPLCSFCQGSNPNTILIIITPILSQKVNSEKTLQRSKPILSAVREAILILSHGTYHWNFIVTKKIKLAPTPSAEKEGWRQKIALHKASYCNKQWVLGFKNKKPQTIHHAFGQGYSMQRLFIQLDPSIAVSLCAHMFMFDISQMCVCKEGGRGGRERGGICQS